MSEGWMPASGDSTIELSSQQQQVVDNLRRIENEKYPLANWYLGALYATKNPHNPDRYSQAGQSLRELVEKLPRVTEDAPSFGNGLDFREERTKIWKRFQKDKARYNDQWVKKEIDPSLSNTIRKIDNYLEANQQTTRPEQVAIALQSLDPMHDHFDQKIRKSNAAQWMRVWRRLEDLAHHRPMADEGEFLELLNSFDHLILGLLAPVTAEDQRAIKAIIDKKTIEPRDVKTIVELVRRRGANYVFFFKNLDDSAWIQPLHEHGFFDRPTELERDETGRTLARHWWPMRYLQRVAKTAPGDVVPVLLDLPPIDNPRVLEGIVAIASQIDDIELSTQLKPWVIHYLKSPFRGTRTDLIVSLLKKWGMHPDESVDSTLEVAHLAVAFQPDPDEPRKREDRSKGNHSLHDTLEPQPRFDDHEYQKIMEEGIRPLVDSAPFQMAKTLISATNSMLRMATHEQHTEKSPRNDLSAIWCPRLDVPDRDYEDAKAILVHTLTYACTQVFERAPESVGTLNDMLRKPWRLFERLRQHLYAQYPNEQTLPWIREIILGYDHYGRREYHFELQQMIRSASNYFGSQLLSADERRRIFDSILSGPSESDYREWMGERYTDDDFFRYRRYFHRMQLRPFAPVLFGSYREYYNELIGDEGVGTISDDDYAPYRRGTGGYVKHVSPVSAEALAQLPDDELLAYINEWDNEHHAKDDYLTEYTIAALSDAFGSVFASSIATDDRRLAFWMDHRDEIARPIYVEKMVAAMKTVIEEKYFDRIDRWIDFAAWIVEHSDPDDGEQQSIFPGRSRDIRDWSGSRRAVVDFLEKAVSKKVEAPISVRDGLGRLLYQVCTQYDHRLDRDQSALVDQDEPFTEAINTSRGRALDALVAFGFWVRRNGSLDPVPEVTSIIDERIHGENCPVLTRPEHALLGMNYVNLLVLNKEWAKQKRLVLFPPDNVAIWKAAFTSFILFNRATKLSFDSLSAEYVRALGHLESRESVDAVSKEYIDQLGGHVLSFYLWGYYPLRGAESLLERFYDQTGDDPDRWRDLLTFLGRGLKNNADNLDESVKERAKELFRWRSEVGPVREFDDFAFWLEARALSPAWRLDAYADVLRLRKGENGNAYSEVKALKALLDTDVGKVVACFERLTNLKDDDVSSYIRKEDATPILRAGLDSPDPDTKRNAERARDNLLKAGRFDILDMDTGTHDA